MPRVLPPAPTRRPSCAWSPTPTTSGDPAPRRRAGPAAWYASFGARTPIELIAAFTDPAPAADAPCDPYGALRQAGWSPYGDQPALLSRQDGVRRAAGSTG
ncbi:DUF317 domain-containing protein [Streptomyces iakyrus]|uniref:DUF317 domain-containing protein n=1 Tax=Streptomyces iakyrus TaxID=68219 RepID=UPI001FD748A1|nr:DUF317 domain-containing protein [Streptomyces iakyrus]